jgi:hypothetical protein
VIRFRVDDPCILPGCTRQRKSTVPFCARCWAEADDGERAMALFALHAPCWPKYIMGDAEDVRPGDGIDSMSVITAPYGHLRFGGIHAGAVLAEYEQRTTLRAIADQLRFRRMSRAEAADLPHEEEDPHDP